MLYLINQFFKKNKEENFRPFYDDFLDTQEFSCFFHNCQLDTNKDYYFLKRIIDFKDRIKTEIPFENYIKELFKIFQKDYTEFTKIKNKNQIAPFFKKNNIFCVLIFSHKI